MSLNKYYYTTITIVVYFIPMTIATGLYAALFNVARASREKHSRATSDVRRRRGSKRMLQVHACFTLYVTAKIRFFEIFSHNLNSSYQIALIFQHRLIVTIANFLFFRLLTKKNSNVYTHFFTGNSSLRFWPKN